MTFFTITGYLFWCVVAFQTGYWLGWLLDWNRLWATYAGTMQGFTAEWTAWLAAQEKTP